MTYKEFCRWCNDRAADGCWGYNEARHCIAIYDDIRKNFPFWKREERWRELEAEIVEKIINPTNALIEKYTGRKIENEERRSFRWRLLKRVRHQ